MTDTNPTAQQLTAHALLIGDRINTAGFEGQVLSSTPLALRIGANGTAVGFRYGGVGFIGLTADEGAGFLQPRQTPPLRKIPPPQQQSPQTPIPKQAHKPISY